MKRWLRQNWNASRAHVFYCLQDPRTEATRYVGVTSRKAGHRAHEHLVVRRGGTKAKRQWLAELDALGLEPVFSIIEEVELTITEAQRREIYWVDQYEQQGASLLNREASWGHTTKARYLH